MRGRKPGFKNPPEWNRAVSEARQRDRGFSDQEVLSYLADEHSIREAGAHFGVSYQRISQITKKYGTQRPAGVNFHRVSK